MQRQREGDMLASSRLILTKDGIDKDGIDEAQPVPVRLSELNDLLIGPQGGDHGALDRCKT